VSFVDVERKGARVGRRNEGVVCRGLYTWLVAVRVTHLTDDAGTRNVRRNSSVTSAFWPVLPLPAAAFACPRPRTGSRDDDEYLATP
jgi:hypothetical protein